MKIAMQEIFDLKDDDSKEGEEVESQKEAEV